MPSGFPLVAEPDMESSEYGRWCLMLSYTHTHRLSQSGSQGDVSGLLWASPWVALQWSVG